MVEHSQQADVPSFLITIDTEGDNLWAKPRNIQTRNVGFLPRFQQLCERHALKPTWLVNFEMASEPAFQEFGLAVISHDSGEIGMHLHPWNSPPIESTRLSSDLYDQPFVHEFSTTEIRDKVHFLTDLLEDTFGKRVVSHRAGRWGIHAAYAKTLAERGYRVDCSVTPGISWRHTSGRRNGRGGPDYRGYPDCAYWMDLDDPGRPGSSRLLEVPMSIRRTRWYRLNGIAKYGTIGSRVASRIVDRLLPAVKWLRPDGRNTRSMLDLLHESRAQSRNYVEFMLHSSELMPGGSPRFPNETAIEKLYDSLEAVFCEAAGTFRGRTLTEYLDQCDASVSPPGTRDMRPSSSSRHIC